jgi:hypothetical protein
LAVFFAVTTVSVYTIVVSVITSVFHIINNTLIYCLFWIRCFPSWRLNTGYWTTLTPVY